MFEYLMPLLVMPTYENTLLDQTCKAAVKRQIEYGKQRGVPWGISESGYNAIDVHLNYQYRAFGVPGLGLKRGLAEDLVIAPYASAMALMVAPEEACLNLQRLARKGAKVKIWFLRIDRLHAVAIAARGKERRGPFLHGASPGDELAIAGLRAPRSSHAEAVRVGPAISGHHAAAAGTYSAGDRVSFRCRRILGYASHSGRTRNACTPIHGSQLARAGSAVVVERPIPRDGHQRGRRLQPLEGPRRDPLARGSHSRSTGARSVYIRDVASGSYLVHRASADLSCAG